jgi:hypothetical protein
MTMNPQQRRRQIELDREVSRKTYMKGFSRFMEEDGGKFLSLSLPHEPSLLLMTIRSFDHDGWDYLRRLF